MAADISCLRFESSAVLGRHPTGRQQIFAVVQGEGWVSGPDGMRHAIAAGQAAFWDRGESHESGTESGMTVLIVQAERLDADTRPA
ncbi:MAG: cupin [Candidatus Dormibacteraeota bacterium]|nr:cupin [Candidatus Dormibacteraeota bacterium]